MNTPQKTCRRCLGKGCILVNSGTGRTEKCPKCSTVKLNGQNPCPPEPTK